MTDLDARLAHAVGLLDGARVADEAWELRPDYAAMLVVAVGVHGGEPDPDSEAALADAEAQGQALLAEHDLAEVPQVAAWREAFRAFGVKPRQAVSSMEALLRRTADGLPRIDRLTDHYNAVSVRHLVPFGGENLAAYAGPPRLVRASGEESFETMHAGEVVAQAPRAGEVVWRDDAGVTCRRWNWRQCVRTRLGPETEDALYILDGLGETAAADVTAAGEELVAMLAAVSPGVRTRSRLIARR